MPEMEWRGVSYLPTSYQVSNTGVVRHQLREDLYKEIDGCVANGLRFVSVLGQQYAVHKLVADAFIPNPEGYPLVMHRSEDRLDNSVENLVRTTRSAITLNGIKSGTGSKNRIMCVETGEVFGSVISASYYNRIPQILVSRALLDGIKVCGLTFVEYAPKDPAIVDKPVRYLTQQEMITAAEKSDSVDEFWSAIG